MQSSYALLMLYYKSRVTDRPDGSLDSLLNNPIQLVHELRLGLGRVIGAVKNYSIAFEALDGMRGGCYLELSGHFPFFFSLCQLTLIYSPCRWKQTDNISLNN